MRGFLLLAVLAQGAAVPAWPQQHPIQTRDALGETIRDVLVNTPSLLSQLRDPASRAAPDLYAEDAARDLDMLEAAEPRLLAPDLPGFGPANQPAAIALFTRKDCAECAKAEADLRQLAKRLGVRVTLLDIEAEATLARALGLDMAPSYALPEMLLRGHMPAIVLERYLSP
ncbi:glutaredoxin family protein [uncultured Roseovarius sp.]|uniref:glutaredoxin family protein n=1 Tax=uncultured Roseovarius sp. TaxID=293344 RepID=UPI002607CCC3|nr:glutaredoxin family protein [uncultured Roseovarius sp.]